VSTSEALVAAIGGGFGLLAAAVRFAAGRITKAMDRTAEALQANTASNAVLSTKIDIIAGWVGERKPRTPITG
jgi:hypothetical protein